jgi:type III secretion protein T
MENDLFNLYASDPTKLMILLGIFGTRTLVVFSMLPMFASGSVPMMVRGGLAMSVAFPVAMGAINMGSMPVDLEMGSLTAFLAKETAVGLILGWGFGAFFAGLQTVGEILDHQTGQTFTQNIDAVHGNNVSLSAQFLERTLFAAMMAAGALLAIIQTLYLSYEFWPPGQWAPAFQPAMLLTMVSESSKLFALSLLLAGPMLLVLFVIDAGMGLLNRAAPQLSIFNITLSLKSLVGLTVLVMALPMIAERVVVALREVAATLNVFLTLLR